MDSHHPSGRNAEGIEPSEKLQFGTKEEANMKKQTRRYYIIADESPIRFASRSFLRLARLVLSIESVMKTLFQYTRMPA